MGPIEKINPLNFFFHFIFVYFLYKTYTCGDIKPQYQFQVGVEFVKHFRAHLSPISHLAVNCTGSLLATVSADKAVKVSNFIVRWLTILNCVDTEKETTELQNMYVIKEFLNSIYTAKLPTSPLLIVHLFLYLKVFDVINFDMINILKLTYTPTTVAWIHKAGDAVSELAIAEAETTK